MSADEPHGTLTRTERDAVLADLGQLLEVLGLGDFARPESPHEVFQMCLRKLADHFMATKNVNVRLSDELHALVKASADADRRSLNSQIVWLLESGLAIRNEKRPHQTPRKEAR